jgi:hypothetical protein
VSALGTRQASTPTHVTRQRLDATSPDALRWSPAALRWCLVARSDGAAALMSWALGRRGVGRNASRREVARGLESCRAASALDISNTNSARYAIDI